MSTLHVYSNGTDTVVARSVDEAWLVWTKAIGEVKEDYPHDMWHQVPPEKMLRIHDENDDTTRKMSAREWAVVMGRGFLCSTEY